MTWRANFNRHLKKSMKPKTVFELICQGLPTDISAAELRKCAPESLWNSSNREASELALRKCPRIDWRAYKEADSCLRNSSLDPVLHYMEHGVFEGRKLKSGYFDYPEADCAAVPWIKVSIVVINRNSALTLDKCLSSLTSQTLKNIEIIVVDDCSDDDSQSVISDYSQRDSRIHLIALQQNCGPHMARKAGVEFASGQYIMFMDSDDFYAPNACEKAYNAVVGGYDLVHFGIALIPDARMNASTKKKIFAALETKAAELKSRRELLDAIFKSRQYPVTLCSKIFSAPMCKKAFNEMADGFFSMAEDAYEMLVIGAKSLRSKVIADKLYNYRLDFTKSKKQSSEKFFGRFRNIGILDAIAGKFMEDAGLSDYRGSLEKIFLDSSFAPLHEYRPNEIKSRYFESLVKEYGILKIIDYLIDNFFHMHKIIAPIIAYGKLEKKKSGTKKTIGLIYETFTKGGIETILVLLCEYLLAKGFNVVFFLHERSENDKNIPEGVRKEYLYPYEYTPERVKQNIHALYGYLQTIGPDFLFFFRYNRKSILWETILSHHLGIPVILFQHGAYYLSHILDDKYYQNGSYEEVLKCLDKLVVLSADAEAYYHTRGINAQYIHNPVQACDIAPRPFSRRKRNLLFMARFSDPLKQSRHTLLAFKEMLQEIPDLRLMLTGDFAHPIERNNFFDFAILLGIADHIVETGWLTETNDVYNEAGVLLLTSFSECFPLAVSEAQSAGLPAVIYDIPIMATQDNESIIRVPQGNFKALARETVALLRDQPRWETLASIAKAKSARFSQSSYISQITELLDTVTTSSKLTLPAPWVYRRIIRTLSNYGTACMPK